MQTILFHYEMLPTTWFYLSSLMIIAVFFRFDRFWSVRNLDLVALILFTPGILSIAGSLLQAKNGPGDIYGYIWLFGVGLFFVIRLLLDPLMVRRPLLEPNLSAPAMSFTCVALLLFLFGGLLVGQASPDKANGGVQVVRLDQMLVLRQTRLEQPSKSRTDRAPGFAPFIAFSDAASRALAPHVDEEDLPRQEAPPAPEEDSSDEENAEAGASDLDAPVEDDLPLEGDASPDALLDAANAVAPLEDDAPPRLPKPSFWMSFLAPSVAILAHMAIMVAMVFIGYRHFGNFQTGVAAAALYLLLPYTSQMPGRLDHLIPGALIVWAVATYRMPMLSGVFIGFAAGLAFYPVFLLPLWGSFYWRRGLIRFAGALAIVFVVLMLLLLFSPGSLGSYPAQLGQLIGLSSFSLEHADGFWQPSTQPYRIPIIAVFAVMSLSLVMWPAQKHLGTLMCCTSAVLLATQFWQAHQGGLHMAWYLPLLVLTIFRPNLEDRTAVTTVRQARVWEARA